MEELIAYIEEFKNNCETIETYWDTFVRYIDVKDFCGSLLERIKNKDRVRKLLNDIKCKISPK